MSFAALEGRRVAVWGYGREGRAALAGLRAHLPAQPLTLFCRADEVDAPLGAGVALRTEAPDAAALGAFDWVVKSPGISAYRPEILAAEAAGTRFTSGTALWFGAHPRARVIGVTGTKGKSTTSALIAHLARGLGVRTALAGNIGLPLLELDRGAADLWVVELSSFQTGEAGPLALGVVTSLFAEHLDWHGSAERYMQDKLRLADRAERLLVNGAQAELLQRTAAHPQRRVFPDPAGWHIGVHAGADWFWRGADPVLPAAALHLPGAHNRGNACAALAALDWLGVDAVAASRHLGSFKALPHRLQPLGARGDCAWVDDSIATTPAASLAAVDSLSQRPLTIILGGFDRGVDWSGFAAAVADRSDVHCIAQGANAARIDAALARAGVGPRHRCEDLPAAVALARGLAAGGVVTLSPGAPSFDQFRNYRERGRRFAELAGFTADTRGITGLGIA